MNYFLGIYYKSKQPKTITPIYSIEYSSRRGDEIEEISTISGSEGKIHYKLYFVLMYHKCITFFYIKNIFTRW